MVSHGLILIAADTGRIQEGIALNLYKIVTIIEQNQTKKEYN